MKKESLKFYLFTITNNPSGRFALFLEKAEI